MKKNIVKLKLLLFAVLVFCTKLHAQTSPPNDEKTQRIVTAYLMATGQLPADFNGEVNYWRGQPQSNSVQSMYAQLKANMFTPPYHYRTAAIKNAHRNAWGMNIADNSGEVNYYSTQGQTYAEMMKRLVDWAGTKGNEELHNGIITRALKRVGVSSPSSAHIQNVKSLYGVMSYEGYLIALSSAKNASKNGYSLQNVSISNDIVNAIKSVFNTINAALAQYNYAAITSNVSGEAKMIKDQYGNPFFSSDARALLVGASQRLIGNDAASIVAAGGGNIVAAGGGNILVNNGGSLVGDNGSAIVAAGGGNIVAAGAGN